MRALRFPLAMSLFFEPLYRAMRKATKWKKDKLQELADKQMLLPSIDYFVGREQGMHEMVNYARPQIQKLLKQRQQ